MRRLWLVAMAVAGLAPAAPREKYHKADGKAFAMAGNCEKCAAVTTATCGCRIFRKSGEGTFSPFIC